MSHPDALAGALLDAVDRAIAPALARLAALEALVAALPTLETLAAVRERVAALEARPPVPGPAGADGPAGKDGVDGLGFDDVAASFDGDRTLSITFTSNAKAKTFPVVLPVLRYQGVWREGVTYTRGDVVTFGGNAWYCEEETTTKKPAHGAGGFAAWSLMVRAGRDGKDGKPGPAGPEGPAGKDWQQVFDATRVR